MQVVQQGHDFHRPLAVVPVPPSAPAAGADFNSRPKDASFDGKWMRKPVYHRTVDYSSTVVCYIQTRMWQRDVRDASALQPCSASAVDVHGIFLFRVGFAMHSVYDLHDCECYLRTAIMVQGKARTDL
jgi:hypothetical protein